ANSRQGNRVWINDGAGSFSESGPTPSEHGSGRVALGDLDGDGDLDAFVANISTQRVWRNDGGGTSSKAARRSIRTTVGMSVSVTWTAT
ncbi:MAG: FG-GAP-like repeat-containing protein, partial [Verrucomicrobiota bacterium]|nr:FG-GAP-like repeat-containing protein [Verrucomicrobiota bacterium]